MSPRRLLPLVTTLAALLAAARPAEAQARVTFEAPRDTVEMGSTGTATVVFSLHNLTFAHQTVRPELVLPAGWSPLFGAADVVLAPRVTDTWLASFSAPPSAAAGVYVVHATLRDSLRVLTDSVVVRIAERRTVDVITADAPAFVASGGKYRATFFVRNRGNVPMRLALSISSTAGSRVTIPASSVDLAAGSRVTVVASIAAPDAARAFDDVIELDAVDRGDSVAVGSTARVLVVPRRSSGLADGPSLPAQLSLRAAGRDAGVSPVVLRGSGALAPGSATRVDFSLRAPIVGQQSIFGERDEYRADFTNGSYRLGLGDESRTFSPLTGSGFPGLGAGFQTLDHTVNAGIYGEQNRWSPVGAFEGGAFVGMDTSMVVSATADAVARNTGAHVGGVTARAHLFSSVLEFETAASDSARTTDVAERAELSGNYQAASFAVGATRAGAEFAGPQRGYESAHAMLSARPGGPIWYQINSITQHAASQPNALFPFSQTISSNSIDAHLSDVFWLGYEYLTDTHSGGGDLLAADQRGPRAGAHLRAGWLDLRGTTAYEQVVYGTGETQPYQMYRLEARADLGPSQWVSAFGESSTGSAFDGLSGGGSLAGMATQLQLPLGFSAEFYGSVNLPRYAGSARNFQGDLSVSRDLPNGSTLMFRQHVTRYAGGLSVPGMNAMYLELRMPLHIPTAPAGVSGRVSGRVVDAATGRGLSNLLVRIGGESVITDADGRVSVSGLKPGHYGVSLESSDRAATGVLVGDVSVDVPEGSSRPATFSVALAQSGRVTAMVRRLALLTNANTKGDSLIDAGPLENAVVALEGVRDTIYQTTDDAGRLDFGHVAPGKWRVRVMTADLPEYSALDVDHVDIAVRSGETRDVEFRVVPKRRAVRMMGGDGAPQVIRSTPDGSRRNAPKTRGGGK